MTAALATALPFALTRAAGPAPSLPFGRDRPDAAPLTERHRPRTLADLYGQGAAVHQLLGFVEAPHSAAFIFEGPTGVGKTSAALALANELGVDRRADFFHIRSGRQDGATVEDVLDVFRFPPWMPGGWRLVLVDECDLWTPLAEKLWLSALEDLPARTVVIFTTNHAEKLPQRFLDRCERLSFAGDGTMLGQDADALVREIWTRETGSPANAPKAAELPGVIDRDGLISFRRVVSALEPMLRGRRKPPTPTAGQETAPARFGVPAAPKAPETTAERPPDAPPTIPMPEPAETAPEPTTAPESRPVASQEVKLARRARRAKPAIEAGPATVSIAPALAAETLEGLVRERERIMREYRKIGEQAIKVENQRKRVEAKIKRAKMAKNKRKAQ